MFKYLAMKANSSPTHAHYGVTTIIYIALYISYTSGEIFCVFACVEMCLFESPGTEVNGARTVRCIQHMMCWMDQFWKDNSVWANKKTTVSCPARRHRALLMTLSVRVGARCFDVSMLPACVLLSQARPLSVSLRPPPLSLSPSFSLSLSSCSLPGRLYFIRRRHSYAVDTEAVSSSLIAPPHRVTTCLSLSALTVHGRCCLHTLRLGCPVHLCGRFGTVTGSAFMNE